MELHVLVKQMAQTDAFDWSIFQFVSSTAAYELAQELIEAKRAEAGAGASPADDELG